MKTIWKSSSSEECEQQQCKHLWFYANYTVMRREHRPVLKFKYLVGKTMKNSMVLNMW